MHMYSSCWCGKRHLYPQSICNIKKAFFLSGQMFRLEACMWIFITVLLIRACADSTVLPLSGQISFKYSPTFLSHTHTRKDAGKGQTHTETHILWVKSACRGVSAMVSITSCPAPILASLRPASSFLLYTLLPLYVDGHLIDYFRSL